MKEITIEDVLKKHLSNFGEMTIEFKNKGDCDKFEKAIIAAMTEYASLNRQGWTRVEDGLPEISIVVWVKHSHNTEPCLAWLDHNKWWWSINSIGDPEYFNDVYNYNLEDSPITHWMPLPNKPSI